MFRKTFTQIIVRNIPLLHSTFWTYSGNTDHKHYTWAKEHYFYWKLEENQLQCQQNIMRVTDKAEKKNQ